MDFNQEYLRWFNAISAQDKLELSAIQNDEKEKAEHNMLVDLGRNDLGKISKFGTVQVEKLHFVERYSNIQCIARHVRYAHSGSQNSLKAYMWYQGHTFESKLFTFTILDRVGGGDAFASGLIYAMMRGYKPMDMVNFAVASSVIKHTIHGDANITDDARTIKEIMNMNFDIQR